MWDCFIANRGAIRCSHEPYDTQIHVFMEALDPRLVNCWKDLHAFSCMINLAYQTTRKLSPTTYTETMISILYRLIWLAIDDDVLEEAIRSGLLVFSSTIFLTRHYMKQRHERLSSSFRSALLKLSRSRSVKLPPPIMLWLTAFYYMELKREPSPEDGLSIFLDEAAPLTEADAWPQARRVLKSAMWVDFVHDAPGEKVFEAIRRRRSG